MGIHQLHGYEMTALKPFMGVAEFSKSKREKSLCGCQNEMVRNNQDIKELKN